MTGKTGRWLHPNLLGHQIQPGTASTEVRPPGLASMDEGAVQFPGGDHTDPRTTRSRCAVERRGARGRQRGRRDGIKVLTLRRPKQLLFLFLLQPKSQLQASSLDSILTSVVHSFKTLTQAFSLLHSFLHNFTFNPNTNQNHQDAFLHCCCFLGRWCLRRRARLDRLHHQAGHCHRLRAHRHRLPC